MKLLLISIVMSLCLLSSISIGNAHLGTEILQCAIFQPLEPEGEPRAVDTSMSQNGLFAELYDVNSDGRPDLAVYSPTYGLVDRDDDGPKYLHGVGVLYEIDFPPQDGVPDLIYIDIKGLQKCSDVVLYYKLFENGATNPDKFPKSAIINWGGVEIFDLR